MTAVMERKTEIEPEVNIFDKAVLMRLELPLEMGLKRKANNVTIQTTANEGWIDSNKTILQSPEFDKLKSEDGHVKSYIRKRCLASVSSMFAAGFYPLPITLFESVDTSIENYRPIRQGLIEDFLSTYDRRVEEARSALKDLFNPLDYPLVEELRSGMQLKVRYITISTPEGLKGISQEVFRREQAKTREMWQEAQSAMSFGLREQCKALVDHMVERLTSSPDGKPKVFRNSLVDNLQEFIGLFNDLNIAGDKDLEVLVEQLSQLTKGVDPDVLRKKEDVRVSTAAGFLKIQEKLDTMIVERPSRMFVVDE